MNLAIVAQIGGVLIVAGVALGVLAFSGAAGPTLRFRRRTSRLSDQERRLRQIVLAAACLGGSLGWLVTGMPVVGAVIAVAIPGVPWLLTVGRSERQAIARVEAVGEWTRRLKDICGTGVGLQHAIVSSTATAPDGIDEEVRMLAARLQAGRQPREALLSFANSIDDPVCDQVVAALILNLTDRGEHLGNVLSSIASAAGAEVATRREVDAKRTQPRFAVRFLTGMTLLTFAYGITRAEYMSPYATATGQAVLAVLAATFIALLLWVRRMSLPPRTVRFLTGADAKSDEQ